MFTCETKLYRGNHMQITEKALLYFSGGDRTSPKFPSQTIHTSLEVAQNCGINKRIASGAMSEGILAELMVDIFGEKWFKSGKMRIKFIKPVVIGDVVLPFVLYENTENGIMHFNVWCENKKGQKIVIGQALLKEDLNVRTGFKVGRETESTARV